MICCRRYVAKWQNVTKDFPLFPGLFSLLTKQDFSTTCEVLVRLFNQMLCHLISLGSDSGPEAPPSGPQSHLDRYRPGQCPRGGLPGVLCGQHPPLHGVRHPYPLRTSGRMLSARWSPSQWQNRMIIIHKAGCFFKCIAENTLSTYLNYETSHVCWFCSCLTNGRRF